MSTTRSFTLTFLVVIAVGMFLSTMTEAKPLVDGFTSGSILGNIVGFGGFAPSYGYNYGSYSPYGYAYYGRR